MNVFIALKGTHFFFIFFLFLLFTFKFQFIEISVFSVLRQIKVQMTKIYIPVSSLQI